MWIILCSQTLKWGHNENSSVHGLIPTYLAHESLMNNWNECYVVSPVEIHKLFRVPLIITYVRNCSISVRGHSWWWCVWAVVWSTLNLNQTYMNTSFFILHAVGTVGRNKQQMNSKHSIFEPMHRVIESVEKELLHADFTLVSLFNVIITRNLCSKSFKNIEHRTV